MANETTSATISELVQTAIGQARYTASQGVFLGDERFCTHRPLESGKGSASFPLWDTEEFSSVSEGSDLSNTSFGTTSVTLTPAEAGLMTTVTRLAESRASEQIMIDIGVIMGNAYRDYVNQTFYALFDGFSTEIGTTNVNISEVNIREGVKQLRLNKTPGTLFLACTPHVYDDLMGLYATADTTTAISVREAVVTTGIMPPIFGVTPVLIDNLTSSQMDAADTKAAIWSRDAIGFVSEFDFLIETDMDISLRSREIVATTSFALGEINDNYGVEFLLDNKN